MVTFTGPVSSVCINRGLSSDSKFWFARLNNASKLSVSGNVLTYDGGPTMLHGIISLQYVDKSDADLLRMWICEVRFGLHPFSIAVDANADLGLGKGVTLSMAKLDGVTDTSQVFTNHARPDKVDIAFPYVARMATNGGAAEL